jgi:hypothetical protein
MKNVYLGKNDNVVLATVTVLLVLIIVVRVLNIKV